MSIPRFYVDSDSLRPGLVTLSEAESQHARLSLRLRVGDEVILFDGAGNVGGGRLVKILREAVQAEVDVVATHLPETSLALTLAVSMPKGPRQDLLIEKCTELGVACFWPMLCERTVARPAPDRLTKWQRIALEACKQSQRNWMPTFRNPASLNEILAGCRDFDHGIIAHPDSRTELGSALSSGSVLVLIGPEGGFSPAELNQARNAGLATVQLGSTILRTETAAIAAAARLLIG